MERRDFNIVSLGSLLNHFAEQQAAQVPANVQQQILQIASVPTAHQTPVVSTPVPIQPKPAPKPIAPSTINPAIVQHKQSFHSKVIAIDENQSRRMRGSFRSMRMPTTIKMSKNRFSESMRHRPNESPVSPLAVNLPPTHRGVSFASSRNSLRSEGKLLSECFSQISGG